MHRSRKTATDRITYAPREIARTRPIWIESRLVRPSAGKPPKKDVSPLCGRSVFEPQYASKHVLCAPLDLRARDASLLPERGKQRAVRFVLLFDAAHVAGHQHVDLRPDAVGVVLDLRELGTCRAAHPPIGDHAAAIAPILSQHRRREVVIVVVPHAVDLVVTRHDRRRIALFDADLEASEIDLPERPLGHAAVDMSAALLLIVARKVLGTRAPARALNASDERRRGAPGQQRIFGKILKVAPAQRIAVNVHPRSQQQVAAVEHHLFAYLLI